MNNEELIAHIQSNTLYDDAEKAAWIERIKVEGIHEALINELILDTENRVSELLVSLGATSEDSDAYKQLLLESHTELKGIGREYREEEKKIEKEALDLAQETDKLESEYSIAQSKASLADASKAS